VLLEHGQERIGEIPQEVEAVGHLGGLGRALGGSFRIGAGPITGDDADAGMLLQPGRQALGIAVFEQGNRALPLKVGNDGAVALAFLPGPVVDADDFRCWRLGERQATNKSEHCIAAGVAIKLTAQLCARISTQGEADLLLLVHQAQRPPR